MSLQSSVYITKIHMNENPSIQLRHPNSRKVHRKRTRGLVMPLPAGHDLQTKAFGNSRIEKYQNYSNSIWLSRIKAEIIHTRTTKRTVALEVDLPKVKDY